MSDAPHKPDDRSPDLREQFAHLRHELRTPVNAILGYSEMMLEDADDSLPEPWREGLENLRALGRHLLAAINELLGPSRAEAPGDPRQVIEAARSGLRDPATRVVAICTALLEGTITPTVAALTADLERIRTSGQRLQAYLETAMTPAEPAPAAPAPTLAPAPTAPVALPPGHILVVDDDRFNRHLLGRALHRQGHRFTLAESGTTALDLLGSQPFDVVLLDVMMPGLSGIEVLARLKSDGPLRDIPVIMISALDELDSVVRCIEMGAEDYLPKPFNPVLLQARVGASLEKKRLRDRELEYLRQVNAVTSAAASLEAGTFAPDSLKTVAERADALGTLARVFERMAREVRAREDKLKREVTQLKVEVDEARKARQVAEITGTDYFQHLRQRAQSLKERRERRDTPA